MGNTTAAQGQRKRQDFPHLYPNEILWSKADRGNDGTKYGGKASDQGMIVYVSAVVHDGLMDIEEDEVLKLYNDVWKEKYKDVDV